MHICNYVVSNNLKIRFVNIRNYYLIFIKLNTEIIWNRGQILGNPRRLARGHHRVVNNISPLPIKLPQCMVVSARHKNILKIVLINKLGEINSITLSLL